ncbi:MFS transporter [Natrialbaceae archaeon A-CW3]
MRGTQHEVIVLCMLGFLATMVARVVISPIVPDLTATFGVTTGAIGLALSGMWAAYAITQFPSGILGDRYGERIVILVAIAGTGLASLLLALSPSFPVFLVLVVALGGAAGLVYSAATSLVTKQADETGRAIGVYIAGGPIAGLAAPPIAAAVGAWYSWRAAIALGAVASLPVLVLFARGVEPRAPANPDVTIREQVAVEAVVDLLSRPAIVYTTVLAVLGAFTWQATASFLPAFLEEFHGYSRAQASLLFSAYFVVHGITQPLTGELSDRFSRDDAALVTMVVGVVGYGLFLVSSSLVVIGPAVVLVGLAMSWGAPLQSKFMDSLSREEQGTGFGLVRTVYMSLGSLGSVVTGVLVDIAGWQVAFGLLVVLMATGTILLAGSQVTDRLTSSVPGDL